MIKVGIVGMGGMGTMHYNAYKSIEDVQVVAVVDIRTDVAKEKVGEDNVRVYNSIDEMLAIENPDLVDVCAPTFLHKENVIKASEFGSHVLCEKPMALSFEEAQEMADAAKKAGKFFSVAHVVRFFPEYQYLKSVVDSGELGRVLSVDARRISPIPRWSYENWMQERAKSGGCLLDLSIHDIDFMQYVFGMPKEASCIYHKMEQNNDFVVSHLIYDKMFITLTSGFYACDLPFTVGYRVNFENGYIDCVGSKIIKNGETIDLTTLEKNIDTGINLSNAAPYLSELTYFTDCIKQNKPPEIVTPESALNTMKLYDTLMKNCKEV